MGSGWGIAQALAFVFLLELQAPEPCLHARAGGGCPAYALTAVLALATLAAAQLVGFASPSGQARLSDGALMVLGSAGCAAARLLGLPMAAPGIAGGPLAQAGCAFGLVAEAACCTRLLAAAPAARGQSLLAAGQAALLLARALAGPLGGALEHLGHGPQGLELLSAASAAAATVLACRAHFLEPAVPAPAEPPLHTLRKAYSARGFWATSLWWACSCGVFLAAWDHEPLLFARFRAAEPGKPDVDVTVLTNALMASGIVSLALSLETEEPCCGKRWRLLPVAGAAMAAALAVMCIPAQKSLVLVLAFLALVAAWSFANVHFCGELRSAVCAASPVLPSAAALGGPGQAAPAPRALCLVLVLNWLLAAAVRGALTAVPFGLPNMDTETAFCSLAALQGACTAAAPLLWLLAPRGAAGIGPSEARSVSMATLGS